MIDFKTICKTFRERADNWERNEPRLGKIVASEIRGIVDVLEEFERDKLKEETLKEQERIAKRTRITP